MNHIPGHPASPYNTTGITPPPGPSSTDTLSQMAIGQIQRAAPGSSGFSAANGGGPQPGGTVPQGFDLPVNLGTVTYETAPDTPRGFGEGTAEVKTTAPKTKTIYQLTREFEKKSKAEQRRMAFLLVLGGFAGPVPVEDAAEVARNLSLGDVIDLYAGDPKNSLLYVVAGKNAMGQKVTADQFLASTIAYRLPNKIEWDGNLDTLDEALEGSGIRGGAAAAAKDKPFTGTKTQTDTNTSVSRSIMDPKDAMALTRAVMQQELGRDPTKAEFEDFVATLQHAMRSNPSRTTTETTTTGTYKKNELVDTDTSTSSFTHQGITEAGIMEVALQKARQNPNWAEWQAMGTYAPALFEALGATVAGR